VYEITISTLYDHDIFLYKQWIIGITGIGMAKWLSWIRSNDKAIIEVLVEQAENLVKAISMLVELMTKYENVTEYLSKITDMEHKGDEFAHKLFSIIDQTFVTPIDREDISKLTSSLDQILDYTHGTADRFVLFKIEKPTSYMLELAKILLSSSQEVYQAILQISNLKRTSGLVEHCHRISAYEHQGDKVYRNAIAELFDTNSPVEIIKFKEIYETLEGALDRCADAADVLEDISLKYT
jgi:predicted phosphate transport protein (TIGR00153 family)